jgi:hypothetical protein
MENEPEITSLSLPATCYIATTYSPLPNLLNPTEPKNKPKDPSAANHRYRLTGDQLPPIFSIPQFSRTQNIGPIPSDDPKLRPTGLS